MDSISTDWQGLPYSGRPIPADGITPWRDYIGIGGRGTTWMWNMFSTYITNNLSVQLALCMETLETLLDLLRLHYPERSAHIVIAPPPHTHTHTWTQNAGHLNTERWADCQSSQLDRPRMDSPPGETETSSGESGVLFPSNRPDHQHAYTLIQKGMHPVWGFILVGQIC